MSHLCVTHWHSGGGHKCSETDLYYSVQILFFSSVFLMGVGSSTANFQTNITIITLAAQSIFPCGWYCDSSCDTQDNVTLTCVGCLVLHTVRHPREPNLWLGACLLVLAECCPPSAWQYFYCLLMTQQNMSFVSPLCHHTHRGSFIWPYWTSDINSAHSGILHTIFHTSWLISRQGANGYPFHTFTLSWNPGIKGLCF